MRRDPVAHIQSLFGGLGGLAKAAIGAAMAAIASYWGGLPQTLRNAVVAALILFFVDTVLGITRAICEERFSLDAWRGFFRKMVLYVSVAAAAYAIDLALGEQAFVQVIVVLMVVLTELKSVIENSEALGFKWPATVTNRLARMQEQICGTKEETNDDEADGEANEGVR